MQLEPVDTLQIQVLIDNVTDSLSTVPKNVIHEMDYLETHGMKELSGECLCCAAHGFSLLLTTSKKSITHTVLFDAGPEGEVFQRNVTKLNVDVGSIEDIVLSHGHWDHAGGFIKVLDLMGPDHHPTFHVNPGMFHKRATRAFETSTVHPFKDIPSVHALQARGARVINDEKERLLGNNMFYLSGEISRVTSYEKGFPEHVRLLDQEWIPDPLLMDERFLTVNVRDKGLIVFSACSHAGIVNVLTHTKKCFPSIPLYAVMGGFHLSGQSVEGIISPTVNDIKNFNLKMIIPAHCTGWRAVNALCNTFEEGIVVPSAVGRIYSF